MPPLMLQNLAPVAAAATPRKPAAAHAHKNATAPKCQRPRLVYLNKHTREPCHAKLAANLLRPAARGAGLGKARA